jgi:hypothetical protein
MGELIRVLREALPPGGGRSLLIVRLDRGERLPEGLAADRLLSLGVDLAVLGRVLIAGELVVELLEDLRGRHLGERRLLDERGEREGGEHSVNHDGRGRR